MQQLIQANVSTTKLLIKTNIKYITRIHERHSFTAPPVTSLSHHPPLLTTRFSTSMALPERIICVRKHDDDIFDVKKTSPLCPYKSPHFESKTRRHWNLYCTIGIPRNDSILSRITRLDYKIGRRKVNVRS